MRIRWNKEKMLNLLIKVRDGIVELNWKEKRFNRCWNRSSWTLVNSRLYCNFGCCSIDVSDLHGISFVLQRVLSSPLVSDEVLPLSIAEIPVEIEETTVNSVGQYDLESHGMGNVPIKGIEADCFGLESVLSSNLECYYDRNLFTIIISQQSRTISSANKHLDIARSYSFNWRNTILIMITTIIWY